MTQRMMRLFDNVTQARTFIREDQGFTIAKAKEYVEKNTVQKVDNKVWVILP